MKTVHVIGKGGHAKAVADIISNHSQFRLGKFVVEDQEHGPDEIFEDDFLDRDMFRKDCLAMGIGGIRNLEDRFASFKRMASRGFEFPPLISTHACVSKSAYLGSGSVVMPFSNVGPGARVGEAAICNTGSNLEHGSTLGFGTHLSTGAVVNGDCRVGALTFIGSNATLEQGVEHPNNTFIRMGELVTRGKNSVRISSDRLNPEGKAV